MATKLTFAGRDVRATVNCLAFQNDGRHRGDLIDLCTETGWHVCDVEPKPSYPRGQAYRQVIEFLARPDSPHRCVLVGYGEMGRAVLSAAYRHPERVTGVVAIDVPCDGDVRSDAARLSCPVLILPEDDPGDVITAVEWFLNKCAAPTDQGSGCPTRLPVLTSGDLNDPDALRRLREAGPIHFTGVAGAVDGWILTGHKVTTTTLADTRLVGDLEVTAGFRDAPVEGSERRFEEDLVSLDGTEHARLRRLIVRQLTPRRIDRLRPRIQHATDLLLDRMPADGVVDFVACVARPLPIAVLCELFAIPPRDRAHVQDWLVQRLVSPPEQSGAEAPFDLDGYLRGLIAERRARPGDDLISAVVAAEGSNLSEEDLISAVRLMLVAGHRAATTLLSSGIAALLCAPGEWERLVLRPELVETAVEELLRVVTPIPLSVPRRTVTQMEAGGVLLPKGSVVAAALGAANRDPACFPDPDVLDVGRQHNPHLSFGHGHHYCLGAAVARVEAQLALATLVRRFPRMRLATDVETLRHRPGRVRDLYSLPLVLCPEEPSPASPTVTAAAAPVPDQPHH